jgi:hypothetical protein
MKQQKVNQLIQLRLPFIENAKKEILVSLSKEEKIELIQALAELMLRYEKY